MTRPPWLGDACGLVEAFRAHELSPSEALEASIAAIAGSELNAFSHRDFERAREQVARADVSLPFGGVPFGVKELEHVEGWPATEASLVFADRVSAYDATSVRRLRASGAVLAAQTTAPEFGGINCTSTPIHGTTRNPWDPSRTPGGSSGGSAAAVAGGLLPIATGSDGGGSIRIPAGFSGLFGLKATYGRVPKGPRAGIAPLTTVIGVLTRSVRDAARYFDCCNGFDPRDPYSLPRVSGWEASLGTIGVAGRTVAIVPDLGTARHGCGAKSRVSSQASAKAWRARPAFGSWRWTRHCPRSAASGRSRAPSAPSSSSSTSTPTARPCSPARSGAASPEPSTGTT